MLCILGGFLAWGLSLIIEGSTAKKAIIAILVSVPTLSAAALSIWSNGRDE